MRFKGNDNAIVNADFSDAAEYIERGSVDLLIVDPPYNLTKNYGGKVLSPWKRVITPILRAGG
ncbi:MAG: hypothetical protein ACLUSP_04050 [Christensenellales bacterium]